MTQALEHPWLDTRASPLALRSAAEHLAGIGAPLLALTWLARGTGGRDEPQLAVTVGLALVACLILRVWRLPARYPATAGSLALAALAVAFLHPAVADTADPVFHWSAAGGYALAALLVMVVRSYASTPLRRRAVVLSTVAAGALQFGWSFVAWWDGGDTASVMSGTFYWYNQYAAFLLAPAIIGFALALEGRRPWRFLGWAATALGGAGVLYSTSRASLVLLLVGWALVSTYALARMPGHRVVTRKVLCLGAATVGVVLAMAGPPIARTFHSPFAAEQRRTTHQSLGRNGGFRLDFWHEAVVVALHHPVDGAGYGELSRAASGHVPTDFPLSPLAHNGLLQAFADGGLLLGIPLLAAVVLVALGAARTGLRAARARDSVVDLALVVALLLLLAHSVLDFDWSYPALCAMWAVVAGLALSRPRRSISPGDGQAEALAPA